MLQNNGYSTVVNRLYPINVKKAEPIGPKFFVGPHVIPSKVDNRIFKNLPLKNFDF